MGLRVLQTALLVGGITRNWHPEPGLVQLHCHGKGAEHPDSTGVPHRTVPAAQHKPSAIPVIPRINWGVESTSGATRRPWLNPKIQITDATRTATIDFVTPIATSLPHRFRGEKEREQQREPLENLVAAHSKYHGLTLLSSLRCFFL
jgi:hypothetical protein